MEQYCDATNEFEEECNWVGEARTPERRRITDTTDIRIDDFYGHGYTIYDKFGHEQTISATYDTKAEAMKEMTEDLEHGERETDGGPYTGVLFFVPATMKLKGTMFRFKNGVCTKV